MGSEMCIRDRTADNVLPMPLLEPPVEFGGMESHLMAAVMPSPSPIDVSDLLDSVALPVPVPNLDNEFEELLAVCAADEDRPLLASVTNNVSGATVTEELSVQANSSESLRAQNIPSIAFAVSSCDDVVAVLDSIVTAVAAADQVEPVECVGSLGDQDFNEAPLIIRVKMRTSMLTWMSISWKSKV